MLLLTSVCDGYSGKDKMECHDGIGQNRCGVVDELAHALLKRILLVLFGIARLYFVITARRANVKCCQKDIGKRLAALGRLHAPYRAP